MAPKLGWEEIMSLELADLEGDQGDVIYEQLAEVTYSRLIIQ